MFPPNQKKHGKPPGFSKTVKFDPPKNLVETSEVYAEPRWAFGSKVTAFSPGGLVIVDSNISHLLNC